MTRPHEIIDTSAALERAVQLWRAEPALAVDTESNSFFVYREKTCLVQVSTRTADWIVDPLTVDLQPLGELFENPAIEKVFHAAEYDIISLKRDYGFVFRNLYDTLIAAKAVGRKKIGLGNLIEEVLATKLAKDEQRSDWGRRPLTADQIEYAFADTAHLLALSDALRLEVAAKGPEIVEEVATDCRRMTEKEPKPREVNPDAFEKHKSIRAMDPVSRQILKHLFDAREARAKETNKPPFRVVSDEALGEIAVRKPADRAALAKVPGITPPVLSRHGDALWAALQAALAAGPLPFKKKVYTPVDPAEEERYEALRAWRKSIAEARGVEVDVIAGNASLRTLAQTRPLSPEALAATGALDAYRTRRYGEAVLGILRGKQPAASAQASLTGLS